MQNNEAGNLPLESIFGTSEAPTIRSAYTWGSSLKLRPHPTSLFILFCAAAASMIGIPFLPVLAMIFEMLHREYPLAITISYISISAGSSIILGIALIIFWYVRINGSVKEAWSKLNRPLFFEKKKKDSRSG